MAGALLFRRASRAARLLGRRALSVDAAPTQLPVALSRLPRPTAPLDRAAFAEPFEALCCDVLSASRAGEGAERDEASQTMAEAACRRATYVTDRWFHIFSEGSDVVTPEQFDACVMKLLEGGDNRAALAFRALDADADGVISETELRKYLRSFNALYHDGYNALHLDKEAAANLGTFCERWTEGLVEGMLLPPVPLTLEAWRARPHAGQLVFIDAFVEHAGHCFGHMESKTDRVIDEIRGKKRFADTLRLALGIAGMGAVVSLFYL